VAAGTSAKPGTPAGGRGGSAIAGRGALRHEVLGVGTGIGRFEIDDVAQQNLAFVQFVAPDG
jgi:hypothetical protein